MDARTSDWFNLAIERSLHETISPEKAGSEFRQAARRETFAVLKAWKSRGLWRVASAGRQAPIPTMTPSTASLVFAKNVAGRLPPRSASRPVRSPYFGRLKDRERASALSRMLCAPRKLRVTNSNRKRPKDCEAPRGPQDRSPRSLRFLEKRGKPAGIHFANRQFETLARFETTCSSGSPCVNALPASRRNSIHRAGTRAEVRQGLEDFFPGALLRKARNRKTTPRSAQTRRHQRAAQENRGEKKPGKNRTPKNQRRVRRQEIRQQAAKPSSPPTVVPPSSKRSTIPIQVCPSAAKVRAAGTKWKQKAHGKKK